MFLMSKDVVLARIDFNKMLFDIYVPDLMPFSLRGRNVNLFMVHDWMTQRVLSLSRSNAKRILDSMHLNQNDRMAICLSCKGLSLTDCYWLKDEEDKQSTWASVNLYNNRLSSAVAKIALTGEYIPIQGHIRTPELTGAGSYAKCWRRGKDGLWLYKTGSIQGTGKEYLVDILCSDLLDKLNVRHVKYLKGQSGFRPVSRCRNMTDENHSICDMSYYQGYCMRNGLNLQDWLLNNKDYYDMLIVDYLIFNTDRHSGNWGVQYNANTGVVEGLHPLYDHNLALDLRGDYMSKVIQGKTLEECAYFAKSRDKLAVSNLVKYAKTSAVKARFYEIFGRNAEYEAFLKRLRAYLLW